MRQVARLMLSHETLAQLLIRHCEMEDGPFPDDLQVVSIYAEQPNDPALQCCQVFVSSGIFQPVCPGGIPYRLGELVLKESRYHYIQVEVKASK